MNTITIELCAEDRARLDAILAALTGRADAPAEHPVETLTEALSTEPVNNTPEPEKPAEAAKEPEREAPKYTQADVLAKVQQLASPAGGKRAEARAIVKEYADRVSAIPEDKFAEVMERLSALEG